MDDAGQVGPRRDDDPLGGEIAADEAVELGGDAVYDLGLIQLRSIPYMTT